MQMIHDEVYGIYPHCYVQLRPAISRFPAIFNVTGDAVVGNGSGYAQSACAGALGEYIERFHFYNEVERDVTAVLRQYNPANVEKKLLHLINQIKISPDAAENHAFDLTAVKNIYTLETFYIPSVIISLAQGDTDDRKFIPFVDSCGQAAHGTQARAYSAALKEFIERQALVGGWLSGRARHAITITEHPGLAGANKIVRMLSQHGELLGYDLSTHLPGFSFVIFYFSHDKKDNVQYSVGMATDFDAASAMRRAYNELWQSYSYMYLNANNPGDPDPRYQ
jgi:ribosomal protein S12 methylthiotransferase accessory factor YcaO